MLESEELIKTALDTAGEDLCFTSNTIKGIPGSLIYNVQSFESPYDVEKQDLDFQVSTKEFLAKGLQPNDKFTYTIGERSYLFRIKATIDDLTGWLKLPVDLEGFSNV